MSRDWRPIAAPDLPDGLVLFDGVCVFCSRWVQFAFARDREARFRFVPAQSAYGRVLVARFGIDPDDFETNAVIEGGQAVFKSDAALAVLAGSCGLSRKASATGSTTASRATATGCSASVTPA
jgi:predicted DCC family thiol-disulfide oxidoreductase YuxK